MSNTLHTALDTPVDNNDYIRQILYYGNRLISEKRMTISDKIVCEKKMYSITFSQPEWFIELDDDLKYNIITNLQSHYNNLLKNYLYDFDDYQDDDYQDDDYQDNSNVDSNSKKRKLSEI